MLFFPSLRRARGIAGMLVVLGALVVLFALPGGTSAKPAAAPALPRPENISCQGYERDTVVVGWKDTASDETNYRVERATGGGGFGEVATISPDSKGNYPAYRDTGANVSAQDRRYRVRSYRSSDNSFSPYSAVCNNRRIFENTSFRIFYGLRGTADECPKIDGNEVCLDNSNSGGTNKYVGLESTALQGSVDAFARAGFAKSAATPPGSLDRVPINVVWCDNGGCGGGGGLGLAPGLIETPFDVGARTGDPIAWLVPLHELFHFQQSKYSGVNDPAAKWVYEGQARSIQDKICIGANRASCQSFDDIATGYAGYVGQVNLYLANTNRPINQTDYDAALFWTYLTEKYGTSAPGDTVEAGLNLLVKFWEATDANPGRNGIDTLNSALAALGHTARFRDIWKDFAVASYAKNLNGPGVLAKYRYADMAEPGGNYNAVRLDLNRNLNVGEQVVNTDQTVYPWAARYYELHPAANLPVIDIKFNQDSTVPLYYTLLAIKGTDVALEQNVEARNFSRTLVNNGYDRVVVIVAGLENLANYRYSFNGTQPSLRILSPTTSNKARVGSPAAPDKFRIAVEVDAADGTPLAGVDPANFSFRVGTQDLPADHILTSATIQGQQWFVVRAPGQSGPGLYDLQVRYSTILTGTQPSAIDYSPRADADSMLVIDRSGSMGDFGKIDAAKAAARLYVDSWRTGDKIGVESFNDTVTLDLGLTDWTDAPSGGSRQTAFNAINALAAGGNTAIGDAVRQGWNTLNANGNAAHDWAIILLSDGLETAGTEKFGDVINALVASTAKRPAVHTVAVGPDADRIKMQNVANATGGTYQYVSAPAAPSIQAVAPSSDLLLNMDLRYRVIATKVAAQQQFFSLNGPLADGDPNRDVVNIPIENGAAELVLSFSWDPSRGSIGPVTLRDPSSTAVALTRYDGRHFIWRVPSPAGGNWTLTIDHYIPPGPSLRNNPSATAGETLSPYLIQAALRSDVTMEVYLPTPVEERTAGVAMPILVSLTDTGPIKGAAVNALVETPAGSQIALPLFDDGAHGDGAANDGLYGGVFRQTGAPGSYTVRINASGTSTFSGPFTRQDVASFHLSSNGDRDGDGLPDEWEIHYGTDPDVPDATADPDNDGLPNGSEWQHGTDPHNPDTDNGGEADGTDPNPLDPSDDAIKPTWAVAYPGNGKVFVKYVLRPEYTTVQLYRGTSLAGPFSFLQQETPGTGLTIDTAVVNGTTYCYQVIAMDSANRRTVGQAPSCATPKADPYPPHGTVVINDGAKLTTTRDVMLKLWASDAIDPEFTPPGDEVLLPAADTATQMTDMLIANQPDLSDGVWQPYAQRKSWRLAQTSGLATVYAKFRDAAGNESAVVAATIYVQLPLPEASHCFDDTYIERDDPNQAHGDRPIIEADGNSEAWAFIRCVVPKGASHRKVKLQLYVEESSPQGGSFYRVDDDWDESVTWRSRPRHIGPKIAELGAVKRGKWAEIDVTKAIQKDGTISLVIRTTSEEDVEYASHEAGTDRAPRLVIGH